jgi:hypothetical protein
MTLQVPLLNTFIKYVGFICVWESQSFHATFDVRRLSQWSIQSKSVLLMLKNSKGIVKKQIRKT